MWISQLNEGRPLRLSTTASAVRRVSPEFASVMMLLAALLVPALHAYAQTEPQTVTEEGDFPFREFGQPTTVFDWHVLNLLTPAQLDLVNKRASYLIESPVKMDVQNIVADVIDLNNNNVSYMKYGNGPVDSLVAITERDEMSFLHSTRHPAAMCGFGDATGVDLRWLPDRRQDYAECTGTNMIPSYRVYRRETNGALTLLAEVGLPADSTRAVAFRDVPQSRGAWLYFVKSLLPNQVPPQEVFLDSLTVRFPVGGSLGDFFWIDQIRQTNPTYAYVDSVQYEFSDLLVSLAAKHSGTEPHSIACTITLPDGTTLDPAQALVGALQPNGDFSYALVTNSAFRYFPAHGGFAVSFYDNTTHLPLFGGKRHTTNPNNRLRTNGFPEYVMNRVNATWQSAWAVESTRLMLPGASRTFDGMYLDSCDADMAATTAPCAEYSRAAYNASLDSMLTAVSEWADASGGAFTMANALGTGAYDTYHGLTRVDAISLEGFAYREWYGSFVLGTSWEQQVFNFWQASQLSNVQNVNALCDVPQDSCDTRLFCYASYLLAASDKSTYCARSLSPKDKTISFLPESQVTLGSGESTCPVPNPVSADKAYYQQLADPVTVNCDTVMYDFKLYGRDFAGGKVLVNVTDIPEWYCRYNSRMDTTGFGGMYRLRVGGGDLLHGGRFWTEAAPDTITLSAGQAAILLDAPIASPTIARSALYPVYGSAEVPSYIAVKAKSWNWKQMWVEVDTRAIGGPASVRLRDDGDVAVGHDLTAYDSVYSSELFYGWQAVDGTYDLPIYARDESGYAVYDTVAVVFMEAPPQMLFENRSDDTQLAYAGTPLCSAALDYDGGGTDLVLGIKDHVGYVQRCKGVVGGVPEFEDDTLEALMGQDMPPNIRSFAVEDYDMNGEPDIFAAHDSAPRLYHNNGDGTLADQSVETGISAFAKYSWTGAWGDYNQDGRPDLLVGRWDWAGVEPDTSKGVRLPLYLLKNMPSGSDSAFVPQSILEGVTPNPLAACTAVLWADPDSNGLLDLIVGDIKGTSKIYLNRGPDDSGRYFFADSTSTWFQNGGVGDAAVRCMASIDYDNDGRDDLIVGQWQTGYHCTTIRHNQRNCLHWMYWPVFGQNILTAVNDIQTLDYDLNGFQDILILPASEEENIQLFANRDPGSIAFQFTDVAAKTGISNGTARCAALWDANDDGDKELFLGRPDSTGAFFYRSIAKTTEDALAKNFVQVKLVGNGVDNSVLGTGARVYFRPIDAGADTLQKVIMIDSGGGSPSPQTQRLTFGSGDQSRRAKVTVWWPNGRVQVDTTVVTGTTGIIKTITEPSAAPLFVSGSVAAQYTALPGGSATWRFTWRTADWSNPALDRVVVYDPISDPPRPAACQIGTVTLRGSQVGVTATIAPSPLGGYLHTMTWQAAPCNGGCYYKYKVHSQNGGHETASAERSFSLSVCLE